MENWNGYQVNTDKKEIGSVYKNFLIYNRAIHLIVEQYRYGLANTIHGSVKVNNILLNNGNIRLHLVAWREFATFLAGILHPGDTFVFTDLIVKPNTGPNRTDVEYSLVYALGSTARKIMVKKREQGQKKGTRSIYR